MFFLISIYIYFLNTKHIVLQRNTSLTVFYLRQITEFKFSVQKTHNLHLDVYSALALNALAFALYLIAWCIFALDKKQLRGCCIEVHRCNILGYVLLFDIIKHYGA